MYRGGLFFSGLMIKYEKYYKVLLLDLGLSGKEHEFVQDAQEVVQDIQRKLETAASDQEKCALFYSALRKRLVDIYGENGSTPV
ncbi:hypothetical protein GLW04_09650 [Halobacillus litoralis]|uniref:Uncharacterized protein n=1 Tax=Halobacillus litoralis TaxID=45668 RepID=A0A845DTJ3_9BACI|nr:MULTISPECIES: hypothetical protein [Halobacillus]MCA1021020.1 hypothetical protein [Halobacillus litoralis]MYL20149.1 hypothetical protein [Halobacillus litoralis]MYL29244.1 hypothetical protein [Halobacillus halophilus]MYL36464.1 hypothetical protein [Halobacillus litoralis]